MKQKIVIKISSHDQKSRTKALKTAVRISGVESASIKDGKLEVIGDGVDAVELTESLRESFGKRGCCLRKRTGYAELVSVGEVKKEASASTRQPPVVWQYGCRPGYVYVEEYPYSWSNKYHDPSFCSIM